MRSLVLLLGLGLVVSGCVSSRFVVGEFDQKARAFPARNQILPSEILTQSALPKGAYLRQVLVVVNDPARESYFVRMLNAGYPALSFFGKDDFETEILSRFTITSGGTSDKLGLHLLSQQTGDFLVVRVNLGEVQRVVDLTVSVSTARSGKVFFLTARKAVDRTGSDIDEELLKPVLNGVLRWLYDSPPES